jgi:multidrug efflux pump subunit AcrA (membrane-fusion protein)
VSAKQVGYGIVADIEGSAAYQISDAMESVQAQIKNGPGPFPCTVLGTIAALPAGTIPEPPAPSAPPSGAPVTGGPQQNTSDPSEATGLRLVCLAPAGTRLINGADATVEVITQHADNVLVLPVEAVAGSQGKGKVDVVRPDQTRETRDVELGLSDGKVIEIKSGLTGDETIAMPGRDLPAGPPGGGKGNGPRIGVTK